MPKFVKMGKKTFKKEASFRGRGTYVVTRHHGQRMGKNPIGHKTFRTKAAADKWRKKIIKTPEYKAARKKYKNFRAKTTRIKVIHKKY